ncbi:hypothetical protein [Mycolicibacterium bacteremicum]|uniref:hypothetical protein n=1 Tax=Mycolicibacterium bacteremicum TaxID=564198 RepID=UPI0013FD55E7|nr:hypothetical protein [Mycolicibacterium bacteremicum]MCV7433959.1 hypothetical protein [Mycolicibacterium bacteremicum]
MSMLAPATAVPTASRAATPSPRQCDPTTEMAVTPSVNDCTAICQPGPSSGSTVTWAQRSAQSLISARGRGSVLMCSGAAGPSADTQRYRPNGSGERSTRRPAMP